PRRTRNASSSTSCACQSKTAPNFATFAWLSLMSPAICGSKTFVIFSSAAWTRLILRGGTGSTLYRRHDLLGGIVEVVGGNDVQSALVDDLLAELDIGAFQTHDQRHLEPHFLDRGDDTLGNDIALHDSAEDVDENS